MGHHQARPANIAAFLQMLADNLECHMRGRMSEEALAKASGVSRRTVGNFLRPSNRNSTRGTSKAIPSGTLANLYRLAAALEIEPWELLQRDVADPARLRYHEAIEQAFAERLNSAEPLSKARPRLRKAA